MLFEKLIIENYGVYAEKSEFDLLTTPKKPIILVGGLNGAGKTTIFEAIMIALYGRIYFGRKITKKDYLKFIAEKIHRHDGKRASHASVEISFKFYHNGSTDTYVVNRSWDVTGASVSEYLLVQKNGESMSDVNESLWQIFIEGLIPLGVARLFFFDGEKIVQITEWGNKDNEELQSSLDMLLGAELINRLRSDLDIYMMRKSDGKNLKIATSEYESMKQEKDLLVKSLDELVVEFDTITEKIKTTTSDISIKESKIASVGGGYANIREELLTQKAVLDGKIMNLRKQIQDDLTDTVPFHLVSDILHDVKKQIDEDTDIIRQKTAVSTIQDRVEKFKDELSSMKLSADKQGNAFFDKITNGLENMLKMPEKDTFFDMSPNDIDWMQQKITKIHEGSENISAKIEEYNKTIIHFEKIESDLSKIPKDDEIGPRVTEINELHEERGLLKSELMHIEQQISSKSAYRKILQSKMITMIKSVHKSNTSVTGVKMASQMQQVLETYSANLKENKIKELESHLLNTTRILLHKKLISKIEIDRDTFEIKVYDDGGERILGGLLSMGERQIVGTSLLWAIARTCGRSLPFVIDTPLGRLDGTHMVNLIERFYPFASHQIILLSTDREIGQKEYTKISEYISKSYRITCNQKTSVTTVSQGYFLEEKIA